MLLSLRTLAAPLDIQRLSVQSVRGEPLKAVAVMRTESGEQIAPACLSLGDESDLPFPDYPLLRNARIMLSPAGDAVEITTVEPVRSPGVAVVLRVQCPGEALTARHFNLLIRQPGDRAPEPAAGSIAPPTRGLATRLTLLHDESVASIARAIHPTDAAARKELEKAIIAANPGLFPQGKPVGLKAGTRVLVPDLREPGQLAAAAQPGVQPPPEVAAPPAPVAKEEQFELPPKLPKKLKLRLSRAELNLKRSEGISDARRDELRRAYRGEVVVVAAAGTEALELKIAQLRESQGLINTQLARLEQAVESLRRSVTAFVSSGPPRPAPPPPPPLQPPPPRPAPELFGLRAQPWILWTAAGAGAVLIAGLAFLLGRRSGSGGIVDQHEARIDALLQEAREAAGPLLAAQPVYATPAAPERVQPPRRVRPPPPPVEEPPPPVEAPPEAVAPLPQLPDYLLEGQEQAPAGVDLEVEAGPELAPAEPQNGLKREMDMALDNSRSMFTDVDRFIAMGRTQNAISLLEFQIQKDPNDRDSWVKLMAVYRQEGMETEFQRAYAEFKRKFPGEI